MYEEIKNNLIKSEELFSKYATKSIDGIRLRPQKDDIRGKFSRDADRIIHSLSYTRYIDKTQVFSFNENDNISKRMTHVNQVSKIARTIGRALLLNEDLIEAAALGHDLGHVPYGHVGEKILNNISLKHKEGYFNHNVQSVRILMVLEERNLCIQTLDAILCHNGELEALRYKPIPKTKEFFLNQINMAYKDLNTLKHLIPMTLEGCVVRISDIIAYLGRDIEDAIRLGLLKIKDIPLEITKVLGNNNRSIINTLIMDVIENSYQKDYISMSESVFNSMKKLKQFNYEHIYNKANSSKDIMKYTKMFELLFDKNLFFIKENITSEKIFTVFLNYKKQSYLENNSPERKVIDYIAGMTDHFFHSEYLRIKKLGSEK